MTPGPTTIKMPQFLPFELHHGTPHDFEPEPGAPAGRFRKDKVGTGEGAAAYGWGVAYLAQNLNVAEEYARNLTPELTVKGKPGIRRGEVHGLHAAMDSLGDLQYVLAQIKHGTYKNAESRQIVDRAMKRLDDTTKFSSPGSAAYEAAEKVANWWFSLGDPATIKPEDVEHSTGNILTVRVKPEDAAFLDWDRPLSEQSEKVKEAFRNIGQMPKENWKVAHRDGKWMIQEILADGSRVVPKDWHKFKTEKEAQEEADRLSAEGQRMGSAAYLMLAGPGKQGAKAASEKLANLGIAGIRYLDQGSRTPGADKYRVQWDKTDTIAEVIERSTGKSMGTFDTFKQADKWVADHADKATSNYVVFREEDLEITHKNGQPVTPAERREAMGQPEGEATRFMPSDHPDAITEAAIRMHDSGKIYSGHGHGAAMVAAEERYPGIWNENGPTFDEGFVTKTGAFLNREQALEHARKIGQVGQREAVGLNARPGAMESSRFHAANRFMPETASEAPRQRPDPRSAARARLAARTQPQAQKRELATAD